MAQRRVPHFGTALAFHGLGEHRHAKPIPAGSRDVADRIEFRVAPHVLGLAIERGGIADRSGEHPVGHDADRHLAHVLVQGQSATRGLESDQTVARRRDPDRTPAVVGVRDRHHTRGDERSRSRRRCPRGVVGVPRIAHRAEPRMFRDGAEAEFRHLRLAECHQARRQVDAGEVAVRALGPRLPGVGALHRRHALDGHVVLDDTSARRRRSRRIGSEPQPGLEPGRRPRRPSRSAADRPSALVRSPRRRRPLGRRLPDRMASATPTASSSPSASSSNADTEVIRRR